MHNTLFSYFYWTTQGISDHCISNNNVNIYMTTLKPSNCSTFSQYSDCTLSATTLITNAVTVACKKTCHPLHGITKYITNVKHYAALNVYHTIFHTNGNVQQTRSFLCGTKSWESHDNGHVCVCIIVHVSIICTTFTIFPLLLSVNLLFFFLSAYSIKLLLICSIFAINQCINHKHFTWKYKLCGSLRSVDTCCCYYYNHFGQLMTRTI